MNRKFITWCVCFVLAVFFMPFGVDAMERTVVNESQFFEALEDASVETIVLSEEITISRSLDGNDNVLVIPRKVKITGGGLHLERAGILLGGSVEFQNMSICFANPVRNAVIANGYSLIMDSVSDGGSAYKIHVFCGGVTDYTGGNGAELPVCGTKGQVIIRGENQLGNIYGGSLSDVGNTSEDQPNDFTGEAEIVLENGAAGFGEIYAHGAREDRTGGSYNGMLSDAMLYKVSGGVTVQLTGSHAITVHGKTGGSKDASFLYTDGGKGYVCSPVLDGIGNITICTTDNGYKANLAPAQESSFSSLSPSIELPKDAILNLTNIGQALNGQAVEKFSGGGILILNRDQTLEITGTVSGNTSLAIGSLNFYEDGSTGLPEEGHPYMIAPQSEENSFSLLPPDSGALAEIQKDELGNWTAVFQEYVTVIDTISMPESVTAEEDNAGVHIPVEVTYASEGFDYLAYVPIQVFVNGQETEVIGDIDYGYTYAAGMAEEEIEMYFNLDSTGESEVLSIYGYNDSSGKIPEGVYEFTFVVPAENMANGETYTFSVKMKVGNVPEETSKPVTEVFPDVKAGQWYVDCIQYVYDRGIMSGSGGLFRPTKEVTRAQAVSVLYRMEGSPEMTDCSVSEIFGDVNAGAWYEHAVSWAYHAGIAAGNTSTKMFNPDKSVTREQLSAFFYKYAGYKGMDTSLRGDLSGMINGEAVQAYARDAVEWMVGAGLLSGSEVTDGNGNTVRDLKPQAGATRAQLAAILQKVENINLLKETKGIY